ncbi:hypothetical protein NIIDMKKI_39350 [Mycobacterium kansasii]|uniref:Response regulatory domain-containing protein n=1 Tax=Mycobacterium kansasii TaxID=1768 RepID=A0A7G1IGG5_MYCKA|nr:hypothetical protein NIIDMKKI_39350 [Mycobacterium kansasii]
MSVMTGPTTDADAAKPHRVLIAEDEALIRMDLAEMLREEGYDIVGRPVTARKPSNWPSDTSLIW